METSALHSFLYCKKCGGKTPHLVEDVKEDYQEHLPRCVVCDNLKTTKSIECHCDCSSCNNLHCSFPL